MTTSEAQGRQNPPEWLVEVAARAGLPVPTTVTRLQGRNESYLVDVPSEEAASWMVKRLTGPGCRERFARSAAHAAHVGPTGCRRTGAPELLHSDGEYGVLVYRAVTGSVSGNLLLVQERFTPRLSAQVGVALGRLHSSSTALPTLPARGPSLPTDRALRAFPMDAVHTLTAGEVDAWRIIQSDTELVGYVRRLRELSEAAPRSCTHGDFRIDQVLVSEDAPHLVDWEEFGLGDPAYDTGNWIGGWVYRAVLDIPTARGDGIGTDQTPSVLQHQELTAETIIRRGVAKLEALSPQITAFWEAYRAERTVPAGEVERVAGYAGWHLLDRLLALAHSKAILPGVPRAAAGVGKRLLANPAGAAEALGLHGHDSRSGVAA